MNMEIGELAIELAKHGCVLVGEFKLTSGLTSPYYIDLRVLPSHPKLFELVADAYVSALDDSGIAFNRIGGIATAGVPIATLVAHKLRKPLLYVRKEERAHGTKQMVEGLVSTDDMVLVLDDVVTTGGNLQTAIESLRELGAKVEHVMVLVDREQGAKEKLEAMGVRLLSIMTSSELMGKLHSNGIISDAEYERVIDYIREGEHV